MLLVRNVALFLVVFTHFEMRTCDNECMTSWECSERVDRAG